MWAFLLEFCMLKDLIARTNDPAYTSMRNNIISSAIVGQTCIRILSFDNTASPYALYLCVCSFL